MSIEGEDFTVACVDSRFDVAPIDPLKNVVQTWVSIVCLYGDLAGLVKATFLSFTVQRVHITFFHCLLT